MSALFLLALALIGCGEPEPAAPRTAAQAEPAGGEQLFEPPTQPNIIIILLDGLRFDRTHFGGNDRLTSPTLDLLASQGVSFDLAFSTSNESLLSHSSLFTGLYPTEIAYPDYQKYLLPDDALTLAEALTAVGYDTAAFIAGGHVKAHFGFGQGFATFQEGEDFGSFATTARLTSAWLAQRQSDKPFFAFVHGYDLHRPYPKASVFFHPFWPKGKTPLDRQMRKRNYTEFVFDGVYYPEFRGARILHAGGDSMFDPGNYEALAAHAREQAASGDGKAFPLSPDDKEHIRAHYDASLLCADTYVGMLIDDIVARGLWDDTLIIAMADHGEDLGDHGYYNHRINITDSTTHVPMVISGGALPPEHRGTRRTELTDAVDLVHTVMDMADSVAPAGARGRSLWALLHGEPVPDKGVIFQQGVLGHSSVRTATHRLVFQGYRLTDPRYDELMATEPIDGGSFVLYHSDKDPVELTDVLADNLVLAEELRRVMVAYTAELARGTAKMDLSPELQQMLRERGYW